MIFCKISEIDILFYIRWEVFAMKYGKYENSRNTVQTIWAILGINNQNSERYSELLVKVEGEVVAL